MKLVDGGILAVVMPFPGGVAATAKEDVRGQWCDATEEHASGDPWCGMVKLLREARRCGLKTL